MNIIISYRAYPCTIGYYFKHALREMGHTVWHVGGFNNTIPWNTSRDYSDYLDIPDYEVPNDMNAWPISDVLFHCPFKPDAIISVDAGFYLLGVKERGIPNCVIATDPHAFAPPHSNHYLESFNNYTYAFVMQMEYMHLYETTGDGRKIPLFWLPYAASPKHHYWNGKNFDARPIDAMVISGLMYKDRRAGFEAMTDAGLVTYQDSGLLLEQTSEAYGESVIAYNFSSEKDLCARFWEGLAYRCLVLTNRIPELQHFPDLQEGVHYEAFGSIDELVNKATYYSKNRDAAWQIASAGNGAYFAGNHTYYQRIALVLDALFPKSDIPVE